MTNVNNQVDLDPSNLSEEAQVLVLKLGESAQGNIPELVGSVILQLEFAKQDENALLVEKLEEVKAWIIPEIVGLMTEKMN